jgi:hypothetical protein
MRTPFLLLHASELLAPSVRCSSLFQERRCMQIKYLTHPRIMCLLLSFDCATAAPKIPVSVPVKFGEERLVEFSVTIDRHRRYDLDLGVRFEDAAERKFARQIIGNATSVCHAFNECGAVSNFEITIRSGQNVILQQKSQPYGHYRFNECCYYRNIIRTPLKPGTYTITISVVEVDDSFRDRTTEFVLLTDARLRDRD